ncbi:MAG: serine--tRNA ligase [bacterium]|nr:serine--tRNA ligase [bacterium]
MIDIELIRKESDRIRQGLKNKQADPALVDRFLALDGEWREGVAKLDLLRHEQKKLGEARKIEEAKTLKVSIKELHERVLALEAKRSDALLQIPNLPDPDVPVGKDASGNKVMRTWGKPPKFDFQPKDHLELGEKLGIIDVETAAKVSGSRFNYLKGDAVLLEFAIVKHVLDILASKKILKKIADKIEKGYSVKPFVPVLPPAMIKPDVFRRMARLEPGQEEERYHLPKDDLYLIGSAEHTMGAMHMGEIIPEEQLPLRYVGFSTSFRREAGSYGKDVRGILRVHQFDKLEIESFTAPELSRKEQDFIVALQEHLMQSLTLPYRVVMICTGDMGGPDARQIDIETWMPGQNQYRETHTSDMMTDYQARRLGTKLRRKSGETEFVHMNDATAFAIGRILIAILENCQTKEGAVKIPAALQKYVGKKAITSNS